MSSEKFFPKVGDKLYLKPRTGNYWVDMVKRPYTVIGVTKSKVTIQACKLIFNGPQYYDTIADDIQEDPNGKILQLNWAPKKGKWQYDPSHSGYPDIAYFGSWEHQPYLN